LLIGKRIGKNWQELEYLEAVRLGATGKPLIVPG